MFGKHKSKIKNVPKHQAFINGHFDMCRSMRGYKNKSSSKYDFFTIAQHLKCMEYEKKKSSLQNMIKRDTGELDESGLGNVPIHHKVTLFKEVESNRQLQDCKSIFTSIIEPQNNI